MTMMLGERALVIIDEIAIMGGPMFDAVSRRLLLLEVIPYLGCVTCAVYEQRLYAPSQACLPVQLYML